MDAQTDGRWIDPSQKSSSELRPCTRTNDQGAICEGIIHTLCIHRPGELYADGSDMRTYRVRIELPLVAICEGSSMRLYTATFTS